MSKLWLPYPEDKQVKKEVVYNLEVIRTVATFAVLLVSVANCIVFTFAFKEIQQFNTINTEVLR